MPILSSGRGHHPLAQRPRILCLAIGGEHGAAAVGRMARALVEGSLKERFAAKPWRESYLAYFAQEVS